MDDGGKACGLTAGSGVGAGQGGHIPETRSEIMSARQAASPQFGCEPGSRGRGAGGGSPANSHPIPSSPTTSARRSESASISAHLAEDPVPDFTLETHLRAPVLPKVAFESAPASFGGKGGAERGGEGSSLPLRVR